MNALIVRGGWEGHEPVEVTEVLARRLRDAGATVQIADTLDVFADEQKLLEQDLIVPHWTMGTIDKEPLETVCGAVARGVGLAGIHGGMGDAFREPKWHFMVGGLWVAHPGGVIDYKVHIVDHADPVTAGIDHFMMHSEQYYMHVDPSNHVLATTTFEVNGCTMPVAWKRMYEKGRVFYCSLGHVAADLEVPEARTIITRGMLWAAAGREQAGRD